MAGRVICPKCGSPGTLESYRKGGRKGERRYLRIRHYVGKVSGRTKYRYCHIGPEDGYIVAAEPLAQPLTNLLHHDYLTEAVEAIEKVLARARRPLSEEEREKAAQQLRELIHLCEGWRRRAEELLRELGGPEREAEEEEEWIDPGLADEGELVFPDYDESRLERLRLEAEEAYYELSEPERDAEGGGA